MDLSSLLPGCRKRKKRVGRGPGSGHGKTATRGTKGHNARSGGGVPPGFEGGQMPIHRRLPKRGFKSPFKKWFTIINVSDLPKYAIDNVVDRRDLEKRGLIKSGSAGLKILGNGKIDVPLIVKADKFSKSAREKIEACGGKVEVI